jgi:predicted site-specific integrase-resolvase
MHDQFITQVEAARLLGYCPDTVQRLIADGYLTTRTLPNGRTRVKLQDVQDLIAATTKPRSRDYAQASA